MGTKKTYGILLLFLCTVSFISCNDDNEPRIDTESAKMYDVDHGKTNLAGMNVYLNHDNDFFGLENMRISRLGDYNSLPDANVYFFYDDFRSEAEVGKYYAAASFDYMALNFDTYAIPINEKYLVFTPTSPIKENNVVVGYDVKYDVRTANTYNLPEWWSTVAVIDRSKEKEVIITLPEDCEVFTIGQIDGVPQIELNQAANKLRISLMDYPNHKDLTGKIELFLRIKESYSLVYIEIK